MIDKLRLNPNKISVGAVIEFMQDNIPQIAWVMEEQGGKVRLMLPNRRESSLSASRILPWCGPFYSGAKSKDEIANILQEHKEKRKSLEDTIDIISLWEMTQGEMEQASILFFTELMVSEPTNDDVAAFAHALLSQKSHFKFQSPDFEIYNQETVENKLELEKAAKEKEVLIGGGANWFSFLWDIHQKGKVYTSPHSAEPEEPIRSRLKNILLGRIKDPETQNDDALWKQVTKQLPDDYHMPLLLAIAWGIVPEHYNFWVARADYDTNHDFAIEHTHALDEMKNLVSDLQEMGTENSIDALRTHDVSPYIYDTNASTEKKTAHSMGALANLSLASSASSLNSSLNSSPDSSSDSSVNSFASSSANSFGDSSAECEHKLNIKSPLDTNNGDYTKVKEFFSSYLSKSFISIDSAQTKDIDDAFTLSKDTDGNFDIHIALACPACAWDFGSAFDKLILQRSTSLYLPEATYHMMPEILSTDVFSLKEKQLKPALICQIRVSSTGEILSSNWDFARVTVENNLHYNACERILMENEESSLTLSTPSKDESIDVDSLDFLAHIENIKPEEAQAPIIKMPLDDECPPDPKAIEASRKYEQTLIASYEFAKIRLDWRIAQGSVIIEKDDMRIRLTEDTDCQGTSEESDANTPNAQGSQASQVPQGRNTQVSIDYVPQNPKAQLIVSELMILANSALANFAVENNIPLIFRNQDLVLPKEFAGVWRRPQDIAKIARSLSGASADTTARPHAGLGLKAYSPVTSPLRRYGDLVNEAQLLHFLYTKKPLWNKEELDKLLFNYNMHNDAALQVQRMRPRYWRFVYMQQEAKRQGEKCGFHAIVSDENDMNVTVTLSREQIVIRSKRHVFGDKALLGQEVYVRLGKITPLRGEVSVLAVQDIS